MSSSEIITWNEMRTRLVSFVLQYTRDKATAEDIVHDVFLKVHDKLPQLRNRDKIAGWIFRIAKNSITDHFRSKSKSNLALNLHWDNDGITLNDCVSACLIEMLETLPAKYREAIKLAEISNISQLELAKKLNISYSGAKSRVQRARQMLRKKMDVAYRIELDAYGNALKCGNKLPCGCD